MKIAILGTRGIPNNYGGFEQFAEYLALGLTKNGHQVTVYNSHTHQYKKTIWKNITIQHIYDPEDKIGTVGQFVYDLLSIVDTRRKEFDILLQLGYTSSSIFFDMHPKGAIVVTNMDGLEWERTKYSVKVQKFLKWAESLAVKKSDHLVSDSIGIQNYLKEKYNISSTYIPYGAHLLNNTDINVLALYGVKLYKYNMLVARLEPENSIEMILNGVVQSKDSTPFLVIGKHENKFGEYLKNKFKDTNNIKFIGGVYDINTLNNLRHFSNLYFHGHTVGGTNPSLLEAMASDALICAHDNIFNATILGEDTFYFKDIKDIAMILRRVKKTEEKKKIANNRKKISHIYSWKRVVEQYELLFSNLV